MTYGKRLVGIGMTLAFVSAAAFVLTVAPRTSRVEQFVLFDVTFTYTKMDADNGSPNKSHFYVRDTAGSERPVALVLNRNRPTNWLTPVDYRNGIVHVRLEVIDKPAGSEITQWTLCYIPVRGVPGAGGYGCTGTGTYREKGVYEQDVSMTTWWQNTAIDYTMGIAGMDLVMKDSNGGNGFTYLRPDFEKFFPTTVRITMVQVSAGSKYDPGLVPLDGGASEGGAVRDAGSADAASAGGSGSTTSGAGFSTGTTTSTTGGSGASGPGTSGSAGAMRFSASDANANGCNCSVERRDGTFASMACAVVGMFSAFWVSRRRRWRRQPLRDQPDTAAWRSSAGRFHSARRAAASYVVWRNDRSVWSGSSAVLTDS
jgi:hypothetical protein